MQGFADCSFFYSQIQYVIALLCLNMVSSFMQSALRCAAKCTTFEDSTLFLRRFLCYPSSVRPPRSMTASLAALPDDSLVSPFNWPGCLTAAPGFSALGEHFLTHLPPIPVPAGAIDEPYLVGFSPDAVASLGISRTELDTAAGPAIFIGSTVATWSGPLATIYSGHQPGVWTG